MERVPAQKRGRPRVRSGRVVAQEERIYYSQDIAPPGAYVDGYERAHVGPDQSRRQSITPTTPIPTYQGPLPSNPPVVVPVAESSFSSARPPVQLRRPDSASAKAPHYAPEMQPVMRRNSRSETQLYVSDVQLGVRRAPELIPPTAGMQPAARRPSVTGMPVGSSMQLHPKPSQSQIPPRREPSAPPPTAELAPQVPEMREAAPDQPKTLETPATGANAESGKVAGAGVPPPPLPLPSPSLPSRPERSAELPGQIPPATSPSLPLVIKKLTTNSSAQTYTSISQVLGCYSGVDIYGDLVDFSHDTVKVYKLPFPPTLESLFSMDLPIPKSTISIQTINPRYRNLTAHTDIVVLIFFVLETLLVFSRYPFFMIFWGMMLIIHVFFYEDPDDFFKQQWFPIRGDKFYGVPETIAIEERRDGAYKVEAEKIGKQIGPTKVEKMEKAKEERKKKLEAPPPVAKEAAPRKTGTTDSFTQTELSVSHPVGLHTVVQTYGDEVPFAHDTSFFGDFEMPKATITVITRHPEYSVLTLHTDLLLVSIFVVFTLAVFTMRPFTMIIFTVILLVVVVFFDSGTRG